MLFAVFAGTKSTPLISGQGTQIRGHKNFINSKVVIVSEMNAPKVFWAVAIIGILALSAVLLAGQFAGNQAQAVGTQITGTIVLRDSYNATPTSYDLDGSTISLPGSTCNVSIVSCPNYTYNSSQAALNLFELTNTSFSKVTNPPVATAVSAIGGNQNKCIFSSYTGVAAKPYLLLRGACVLEGGSSVPPNFILNSNCFSNYRYDYIAVSYSCT